MFLFGVWSESSNVCSCFQNGGGGENVSGGDVQTLVQTNSTGHPLPAQKLDLSFSRRYSDYSHST